MEKLKKIISLDVTPGILLALVTVVAILLANLSCCEQYRSITRSVEHWINDGLMVIFFLLVGLEIKREVLEGNLASKDDRILPIAGAIGGMAIPALIYIFLNPAHSEAMNGWAIACATDIAFALGALSLLGKRVPASLKTFLTALAIIDDLGAVLIIAIFYSHGVSASYLGGAALILVALWAMNSRKITAISPYLVLGVPLWLCILNSGVHATVAGVLLALTIPLKIDGDRNRSPLIRLEHFLKPWVNFIIMPVFALANAGVSLAALSTSSFQEPVTGGILFGLFIGKQLGVFFTCFMVIKWGGGKLPAQSSWGQLYGVSILTGIGFTMSLFISALSFTDPTLVLDSRLGIVVGSFLSAVVGLAVLSWQSKSKASVSNENS